MSRPASSAAVPAVGIAISARHDRGLLRATLQSIARLATPPSFVAVVVPRGLEHLIDHGQLAALQLPITISSCDALDGSWLTTGFRALAPTVDVAIFVAEGTVFESAYLERIRSRFDNWEDLVGLVEIVSHVLKVKSAAELADVDAVSAMRESLSALIRRRLRARSLMPNVLSLRVAACGLLNFAMVSSSVCDWISYALLLDQLRARGRTAVEFAAHAGELRFGVERRSGFDFGYAVYDRLERINDYTSRLASPPTESYLKPRSEQLRLFAEQALQYIVSACTKRHIITVLHGMLAARRDLKARASRMRREIRDLA